MLTRRKLTKGKRCVSDFRHKFYINSRIAKTNLAFPLVKNILAMLGSSKCEVLVVIDFKDTFAQ